MENSPKVSICCLTYNHAPYIRQCIDGFLMQKTTFSFEILIHDDCSTDGTTEIIREYETLYPNIIKPLYEDENQWVKGRRGNTVFNFPRAKGKYIALCEGDDYWTDPYKLQKQVDFLEAHPKYVMCSHRFKMFNQDNCLDEEDGCKGLSNGIDYDINTLVHGSWYFHPLTVMFRLDALDLIEYKRYKISMDAVLFFHILKKGKGYMLPDIMGVYRIHSGGVWSGVTYKNKLKNEFQARIGIYEVEQSYEAAFFIRNQFTKWIPRVWMLKEWKLMLKSFKFIKRHFGFISTLNLFCFCFLINKRLEYK